MNGSLLDKKTLAAIIMASPDLPGIREEAVELLAVLKRRSVTPAAYYSALVLELTNDVNSHINTVAEISDAISAKRIGALLRQMGLTSRITRDGYRYAWTTEQRDILNEALAEPAEAKLCPPILFDRPIRHLTVEELKDLDIAFKTITVKVGEKTQNPSAVTEGSLEGTTSTEIITEEVAQ
jgi:hypothetical protein